MKRRIFKRALLAVGPLALAGSALFLAFRWQRIPERIPPHFNGAGQIDAWGEKSTVLILPILGGVVLGMLQFVAFLCAGMKTPASARPMLAMETMCRILGALTALVFAYLTVCSALAVPLGGWFMPAFAAAAALPIVACVIWACIPKRK